MLAMNESRAIGSYEYHPAGGMGHGIDPAADIDASGERAYIGFAHDHI
eukprot:SAG31_NODE_8812_length_1383_cov_0.987539_2_plen_48_part_00